MRLFILSLGIICSAVAVSFGQHYDCQPRITAHEPVTHGLPYTFYDQATESIHALFPKHTILIARRTAHIGQVDYAMLAYQETPEDTVHIIALAVYWENRSAWNLDADCSPDSWPEGLLHTMEILADLPNSASSRDRPSH
jgi:hypothetical protein